ncbi:ABC transporter ATP-binding protein [Castellaniella defragrans]|uniref:ABC transporter ATP-binding protein n=1 Tax=Castellaniella defragrans TaxID=75697 RepID=UPI002AFFF95F|nr:ABC transporter ATP-binding protein [Castellaniella defragrans]
MLLRLESVNVFYGPVQALHEVSIEVAAGEVVAVLGGNASGKSTTIKTVLQLVKPRDGRVLLDGEDLAGASTPDVIARGVASIPESRRLFAEMTVEENVLMGLYAQRRGLTRAQVRARLDEAVAQFPRVRERLRQVAGTLSGGEQQMVAMARALIQRPRIIVIDEPSMGLSPAYVDIVYDLLFDWKRRGTTMLVVEQSANRSLALSDRAYVLQNGAIVMQGPSAGLARDPNIQSAYLGGMQ